MSHLLPESFGHPPDPIGGEQYVGDYGYCRRVNTEHPEALMWFLRLSGYRPPEECCPGLHEGYEPHEADAYLVLTDRGFLLGDTRATWLPRASRQRFFGDDWGRGHWYRPLSPFRLISDAPCLYRCGREYLLGVDESLDPYGAMIRRFGPKVGRAMRWARRGEGRRLYVVDMYDHRHRRVEHGVPFPRLRPW